jgi:hypothetical protein
MQLIYTIMRLSIDSGSRTDSGQQLTFHYSTNSSWPYITRAHENIHTHASVYTLRQLEELLFYSQWLIFCKIKYLLRHNFVNVQCEVSNYDVSLISIRLLIIVLKIKISRCASNNSIKFLY